MRFGALTRVPMQAPGALQHEVDGRQVGDHGVEIDVETLLGNLRSDQNRAFWPHTLVVLLAAAVGGYLAGYVARRLPAIWLRRFILLVGTALTLYYFLF